MKLSLRHYGMIISGLVTFIRGAVVTDGSLAAKLSPTSTYVPASVLQGVTLTAGATYEVSADIYTDGRTRATLGVKWDNGEDGPAQSFSNVSIIHKVTVRFTVPAEVNQAAIYCKAIGSTANGNWATVDNFKLVRIN